MALFFGRRLKTLHTPDGGCVNIIARHDGAYEFHYRFPCEGKGVAIDSFASGAYISAEAAEAAARQKFNL